MIPEAHTRANVDNVRSGLARGVRKGMQVAALAAALVPLGSIPVTPTDHLIGSPSAAQAAPGDQRLRADSNLFIECDGPEGSVGTALASVPGGKAGFPASPTLLVTSCIRTGTGALRLSFTDPNGSEGPTVVKGLDTVFPSSASAATKPTNGWEALVLRADKGDLLACGTNGTKTVLWSIDFSPFNTIADGSATFLRNGPTGSSCDGIAWDPSDSTVYQTPLSGFSVFHTKNDGTALSPVVVPAAACSASTVINGLGIAGTSLFVTCAEPVTTAAIRGKHPTFAARQPERLATRGGGSRDRGLIRLAALDSGRSPFILTGGPTAPPPPTIAQLYKVNGSLVQSFQFNCDACGFPSILHGVPDDPASLASEFNEVLWTLDESGRFWGFEMAGGTIGQRVGLPVLAPGSCPTSFGGNVSSDGDGLLNCWKNRTLWVDGKPGINYAGVYSTGASIDKRDVTLCVNESSGTFNLDNDCAKAGRKDLFVEVDYMDFHKPDPVAIANVIQMFANAPAPPAPVSLHVQVDDLVVVNGKNHYTNVAFVPCTAAASASDTTTVDFDAIKKLFFGTAAERSSGKPNALNAKALVFRYGLMAHNLLGLGTTSGCAEIGGNDFVVSLGSWASVIPAGKTVAHNAGNTDQQGGTFGHEFGHTLGLRHGGGDNINCKPNYESIMNYSLQFLSPTQRQLNYSTAQLPTLDRTNLNENDGIGPLFSGTIVFGPVPFLSKPFLAPAGGPINWNPNVNTTTTDTGLSLDLAQTTSSTGGCPAGQKGSAPDNVDGRLLIGFNDWAKLQFNFRTSVDFADGGHITSGEQQPDPPEGATPAITLQTAAGLSSDATPITVDFKSGGPKHVLDRKGVPDVEVVLFSATGFDATKIVPDSLFLQGDGWSVPVRLQKDGDFDCAVRDAHRKDKLKDLVCHFKIPKDTLGVGETQIIIIGATNADPPLVVTATVPIQVRP